jgi:hypothetical protein
VDAHHHDRRERQAQQLQVEQVMGYHAGSVKQDPATLAVAVRTSSVTADGRLHWSVMTVDRGGHYASYDEDARCGESDAATN